MSEPVIASAIVVDPETADIAGEFPLELSSYALHLMIVISRQRELDLERLLQPHGSSFVRHRALSVIRRVQPCTMRDLAEFGSIDRTTMTRTVDQLVEAGLVIRTTPPTDRRQVLLSLTPAGVAAHTENMKIAREFTDRAVAGIEEQELRAAVRIFEKIGGNVVDGRDRVRRMLLRVGRLA